MSVIIRGMEMPKSCGDCSLCLQVKDLCIYCMATGLKIKHGETDLRDEDCPLSELPEKHGRLIDVDALIAKEKEEYEKEDSELEPTSIERLVLGCSHAVVLGVLSDENAPIILDREE